jgi:hypothetical protein
MSSRRISLSPDLAKLRAEGYDIEIAADHLLVRDVPYVTAARVVKRGILVSTLHMAGETTTTPDTHVAMFVGEYPCDNNGVALERLRSGGRQQLSETLAIDYSFSSKPPGGYTDYHHKMTSYVAILQAFAQALDPTATAQTTPVIVEGEDESVFQYMDTATTKAGIGAVNAKLRLAKVAIVGLGGTGSYVLDLISKCPIGEIHLWDGDTLFSHNAFRAPGAASVEELNAKPKKVRYMKEHYSKLHRHVIAHDYHIEASNVAELDGMDFVFLCMDAGSDKMALVEHLEAQGLPFIDVGMGVSLEENTLRGIVRVTSSTPQNRGALRRRVSLVTKNHDDDYDANIQVADLNALNAALAVIKWKKLLGFYADLVKEHHGTYTVDCDMLLSEEGGEA